ncbi:MAG: hypothetical protein AAF557_14040 [Pseudomonadota bacterium]
MTRAIGTGAWMLPHLIAIGLSMTYAWHVSQSAYVQTGLQFIAPLLIILLCHLAILAAQRRLAAGYAGLVLKKSMLTTFLLIGLLFGSELLTPHPSHAAGDTITSLLSFLFCLVVLAVVLAVAAGALYLIYLLGKVLLRAIRGDPKDDGLNDLASMTLAVAMIAGASFEGVPGAYRFSADGHSTASYPVDASPGEVWAAMQTATSPDFPLPDMLDMFPRPIAVLVDEGTVLGANRVVLFRGREGQGKLHLRVVSQTGTRAVFEVVSDTSPMARWVALKSLTYTVVEDRAGAHLDVRLDYDRLLAPSWIFTPMIESATYLAASVLARDTVERAEKMDGPLAQTTRGD